MKKKKIKKSVPLAILSRLTLRQGSIIIGACGALTCSREFHRKNIIKNSN